MAQRVQQSQERQKTNHDQHVQSRTFQVGDKVYVVNHKVGDKVYVVNHRGSPKWLQGVVVKLLGPLNLLVKVKGGQEAHAIILIMCVPEQGRRELTMMIVT